MRIRALIGAAAVAAAVLASGTAVAHQTTGVEPADKEVKCGANVTTIPAEPPIYVDVRDILGGQDPPIGHSGAYTWNFWVYSENNDHPGLQTKEGDAGGVLGDLEVEGTSSIESCTTSGHLGLGRDALIF